MGVDPNIPVAKSNTAELAAATAAATAALEEEKRIAAIEAKKAKAQKKKVWDISFR